jgi:hypothetical protein
MGKKGDKRIRKLILSFFVFLLFMDKILGSQIYGAIESKKVLSFHFDKIEARGALSLFIKPGKRNRQIEYFADSSIIDTVTVRVSNRTLFLDANNSFMLSRRIPLLRLTAQRTFPIEVFISIEELKQISLLDHCSLQMESLRGEELKIFTSSTGFLHASDLLTRQIKLRQEGNGDVFLKGREVINLSAEVYGQGSLRCEELFLDRATIRHFGEGQIIIAPTQWMDAKIFGSGNIELLENPLGKVVENKGKGGRLIQND